MEAVQNFNYLGHMISSDFTEKDDVEHKLHNFKRSFNCLYREFKCLSSEALMFLFKSYCVPRYGLPLWNHTSTFNCHIFKTFAVNYNNAMKKVNGVPGFASSHITANRCNSPELLPRRVALIQAGYCRRLLRSNNPLIRYKLTDLKVGYLLQHLIIFFREVYGVSPLCENLDILTSRVQWVQRNEERMAPCVFYGV